MNKFRQARIVQAYIPNPLKGVVLVIDVKNKKVRRETLRQRAKKLENFSGVVYGFSDSFLQELKAMTLK